MRPKLRTVQVAPVLPPALEPLRRLATNIYWDWVPDIVRLFARIDAEAWERSGENPVALLGAVGQERLRELSADVGFLSHLGRAEELLLPHRPQERHRVFSGSLPRLGVDTGE
ncbi:MAG: DUF3417 domain-containing protein, partial [Myxococcota bacterium]